MLIILKLSTEKQPKTNIHKISAKKINGERRWEVWDPNNKKLKNSKLKELKKKLKKKKKLKTKAIKFKN